MPAPEIRTSYTQDFAARDTSKFCPCPWSGRADVQVPSTSTHGCSTLSHPAEAGNSNAEPGGTSKNKKSCCSQTTLRNDSTSRESFRTRRLVDRPFPSIGGPNLRTFSAGHEGGPYWSPKLSSNQSAKCTSWFDTSTAFPRRAVTRTRCSSMGNDGTSRWPDNSTL